MITGFRITNLKAIGDSGYVPLVKINVLVGKNSAGKSSLLRFLPLLRQSVEQRTKGPILWYGRFVDFGNFQDVVNSKSEDRSLSFEFELSLTRNRKRNFHWSGGFEAFNAFARKNTLEIAERARVRLTLGHGAGDEVGRVKSVELDFGADSATMKFGTQGELLKVLINDDLVRLANGKSWQQRTGKLLPIPVLTREETFTDSKGNDQRVNVVDDNSFGAELTDALLLIPHGNTTRERIAPIVDQVIYSSREHFYEKLMELPGLPPSFAFNVKSIGADAPQVREIRKLALLNGLTELVTQVDLQLENFANSVRYVEPVRAIAQRYYRLQDLAVDEIDSSGGNAAMYLNSLSLSEMSRLREWMLSTLGFHAEVERSSGHVQVKIVGRTGGSKNIADLGFGFSQLLPIILQAWRASASQKVSFGKERIDPLIAIEQPELHLHPQYQAQVADVLAAVVGPGPRHATFFVETHSEHFVNRLGQLVEAGKLKAEDVQVLVVEQQEHDLATVKRVSFDRDGFLGKDWPAGFFVPREA